MPDMPEAMKVPYIRLGYRVRLGEKWVGIAKQVLPCGGKLYVGVYWISGDFRAGMPHYWNDADGLRMAETRWWVRPGAGPLDTPILLTDGERTACLGSWNEIAARGGLRPLLKMAGLDADRWERTDHPRCRAELVEDLTHIAVPNPGLAPISMRPSASILTRHLPSAGRTSGSVSLLRRFLASVLAASVTSLVDPGTACHTSRTIGFLYLMVWFGLGVTGSSWPPWRARPPRPGAASAASRASSRSRGC